MDNLIFLKVIMIYKIRKEEVNTLVFTLLITFSLVTGVECLIYTAYQKLNVTPRNLDNPSVAAFAPRKMNAQARSWTYRADERRATRSWLTPRISRGVAPRYRRRPPVGQGGESQDSAATATQSTVAPTN